MGYTLRITSGERETEIPCEAGQTIAEALEQGGWIQIQPCGGRGVCGKCKVLASGALEPPDQAETTTLGDAAKQGARLACRARICGDCAVTLQNQGSIHVSSGKASQTGKGHPFYRHWGVAVDIGTTTLAAQLYHDGVFQGDAVSTNPQGVFGADVMTRIGAALAGEGRALQKVVVGAIEEMIVQLTDHSGVQLGDIDAMVLTGNTTMLYLLTGRNPETLSHAPFAADCLFGETLDAKEIGFSFPARCYLPRCIAAFVGADITTAMLASGMLEQSATALLVDIGTNGEMVLAHAGRLLACSCAAGPALEGMNISCGMRASSGAIEDVAVTPTGLSLKTIGNAPPTGLCGSGILAAINAFLGIGLIAPRGNLVKEQALAAADPRRAYLCLRDGKPALGLVGGGCPVVVTQKDIRQVQLAKGALLSGLHALLQHAGLAVAAIDRVLIAGQFGAHLPVGSLVGCGIIPQALAGKVAYLGNTSKSGAALALLSKPARSDMEALGRNVRYLELSALDGFDRLFVGCLDFPWRACEAV